MDNPAAGYLFHRTTRPLSRFVHLASWDYPNGVNTVRLWCWMVYRTSAAETPIERIYREVNGQKMPTAVKRVLLPKRKIKKPRV